MYALSMMPKDSRFTALAIDTDVFGNASRIHPTLLWNDEEATLIDAGFPGMFCQLKQAIEKFVPFEQIKHIILTHQDWDHTGCVPQIIKELDGKVKVLAHTAEKPYLEGSLPHYKLTPERIAARVQSLPESLRQQACQTLTNLPHFRVDQPLEDGQQLSIHGGVEVIHVPGHTPGNISLYAKSHRLLIAGDQLRLDAGRLVGPAPEHTPDMPAALRSLKKLLPLEIETVICYHGGAFSGNIAAILREIAGD